MSVPLLPHQEGGLGVLCPGSASSLLSTTSPSSHFALALRLGSSFSHPENSGPQLGLELDSRGGDSGVFLLTPKTCFSHTNNQFSNSLKSTRCPTSQFSPDTHDSEVAQTPQAEDSVLQDHPHLRCSPQMGPPSYPHFCWPTTSSGFPQSSPQH